MNAFRRLERRPWTIMVVLAACASPRVESTGGAGVAVETCGAGFANPGATGSLYCMELVAIPELAGAAGVVELRPPATPTWPDLTAEGVQRYEPVVTIRGLPGPDRFDGASRYIAWATTLSMDTLIRLGTVTNGSVVLPPFALDQFRILVSAETSPDVRTRSGRIVLRGTSPSTRLLAHRDMVRSSQMSAGATAEHAAHGSRWPAPPHDPRLLPMPAMEPVEPNVAPYLPPAGAAIPFALPRSVAELSDGDTLVLEARPVRRTLGGRTVVMFGFNGQYPGPLIRVRQASTIHVDFRNALDLPSTVHWHGIRLENAFDGVPHLTQELVPPGGRFLYRIRLPDAGIYWYHPHHREDITQELGLYGNLLVDPLAADYYGPANREEVLILDDLLIGETGITPFGLEAPTHALMGRFGNLFLVNGEPDFRITATAGEIVRLYLTNVSNARVYHVSIPDARMKLVASDVGRFEREEWVTGLVMSPAERYVVDVLFERPGDYAMTNRVRALNHAFGTYFAAVDTLARVQVAPGSPQPDHRAHFAQLRSHGDVVREIDRYRRHFERPPTHRLTLTMRTRDLPHSIASMASGFPVPVDWNDGMPMMNWATTGRQIEWIVRDDATGRENDEIRWRFRVGDLLRLRIFNDPDVFHAMAHPIHLHGQRLLVLSRNGVRTRNLVWKDTALIQVGETVELVVELSNPGVWMIHCHIAEHLGSGMHMAFEVSG